MFALYSEGPAMSDPACVQCGRSPANQAWVIPGACAVWRVCRSCHRGLMAEADEKTSKLNETSAS